MNVNINQMEVLSATLYLYQLATTQIREESKELYEKLIMCAQQSTGAQIESLLCQLREEERQAEELSDLIVKMGAFIQSAAIDFGDTDNAFAKSTSLE